MSIKNRTILITGAARRIGRELALTAARAGANIVVHHSHSPKEAEELADEIRKIGSQSWTISADFSNPQKAIDTILETIENLPVYALVNNAAIFKAVKFKETTYEQWQTHFDINLTSPFLISQAFARLTGQNFGRIINIIDWRALRPGRDHFPYTISKAALAAMTQAMAVALAPNIQVNALALGAILPPSDENKDENIIKHVPAGRWAELEEVGQAFMFLLDGPSYITGEIIHLDGGRHLV
jgi:NAD(P)-dependent dehydrogenase (short-subunit alcohol dehydrogenase family)